ncbi:MAG: riboflavin synthase [Phycisphaerae bacterium]|jgi:riboflavin synthase alpha subunit
MFAGIVEYVGRVAGVRAAAGGTRLEIDLGPQVADGLALGASVAVNGVCLTLADKRGTSGAFDVVPETLRASNLGSARVGDAVNLERSLRVGGPLDGHFVQGHVDGVGIVMEIERSGDEYVLWTHVPADLMRFIVRKGSIAIDGVSLTVVDVDAERFSVALIPTTLERTVLSSRRIGDRVNIETDILARLVAARLDALLAQPPPAAAGRITWEMLRQQGFVA